MRKSSAVAQFCQLEVLTSDGARFWVGPTSDDELAQIIRQGGRKADLYAELASIRDEYAQLIREKYPSIKRRVSGYNLDQLLPENGFNVVRALVGSEGICVSILQARLRLITKPKHKKLIILGYDDIFVAGDSVATMMPYSPIAMEGLDWNIVGGLSAHQTLNSTDGARQTDWSLAAAQVNEDDSLGGTDDFGSGLIPSSDTRTYLSAMGQRLAEQNVQTLLSLYFNEPITGVDCSLAGDELDLALVGYEQSELSGLTAAYFSDRPQDEQANVFTDISDLMNYRGVGGFAASIRGDGNTKTVITAFWPDGDFDIGNEAHRIRLGQALVRINYGQPWNVNESEG